jgi:serine/threonine-protein kinase
MTNPSDANDEKMVGKIVADRYRVMSVLGEGCMSSVYQAEDMQSGTFVALKTTKSDAAATLKKVKRFQQEATAVTRLSHPGIVRTLDSGITDDGTPYLVMDLLEGRSLRNLIDAGEPLPLDRCIFITSQVSIALEHAHGLSVLHRDINPSNIMLIESGGIDIVKVLDFGFAKILEEGKGPRSVTASGEVLGTLYYMSPEQSRGKQLDLRSDIYSLGCVFYELVTRHTPFTGGTVAEIINKQMTEKPLSIGKLRPDLKDRAAHLDSVVSKALAGDPGQRFQSMQIFREALENPPNQNLLHKLGSLLKKHSESLASSK